MSEKTVKASVTKIPTSTTAVEREIKIFFVFLLIRDILMHFCIKNKKFFKFHNLFMSAPSLVNFSARL